MKVDKLNFLATFGDASDCDGHLSALACDLIGITRNIHIHIVLQLIGFELKQFFLYLSHLVTVVILVCAPSASEPQKSLLTWVAAQL